MGSPWALLGPPWGHLGAILAHLGAILGHLGTSLAPSWAIVEPCWAMLCPSCANLVPFGLLLELSGRFPGPFRDHLGAILGSSGDPSWAHPLILWANRRALLRFLNQPFYLSFPCLSTPKTHLASRSQALKEPRRGREAFTIMLNRKSSRKIKFNRIKMK